MYEIDNVLQNAHRLHQEGQTAEALAALQQAVKDFPGHPALWSCYGLLCRHEQRLDESVARAIELGTRTDGVEQLDAIEASITGVVNALEALRLGLDDVEGTT